MKILVIGATGMLAKPVIKHLKIISTITGASVSQENRWFPMIDQKYKAEQEIINSGISYMIFRPSWFFESLELMVRNGKATIIGKQRNFIHWIAADDYAKMVTTTYNKTEARNKIFYALGQEKHQMKPLLEKYCAVFYPEIKSVKNIPIWMAKFLAKLIRSSELLSAARLFAYFDKVSEPKIQKETSDMLGEPDINFEKWMRSKHKAK